MGREKGVQMALVHNDDVDVLMVMWAMAVDGSVGVDGADEAQGRGRVGGWGGGRRKGAGVGQGCTGESGTGMSAGEGVAGRRYKACDNLLGLYRNGMGYCPGGQCSFGCGSSWWHPKPRG